jgi:hypothetical protein
VHQEAHVTAIAGAVEEAACVGARLQDYGPLELLHGKASREPF